MKLKSIDVPTESELFHRHLNTLTDLSSQDIRQTEIKPPDVSDIRDSRVHRKRRSLVKLTISQPPVDEAHHAVAPPVLLRFADDVGTEHVSDNASLTFSESDVCSSIKKPPGL